MKNTLKKHFGYDEFRPLQEEIIGQVLEGKDCVVLMPTGGGKSLCFQLPALMMDGLTIVVSPLISLMKDQVDALKMNGVSADLWNSTLSREEVISVATRAKSGELKILYIAPERFLQRYDEIKYTDIDVKVSMKRCEDDNGQVLPYENTGLYTKYKFEK